jgi:BirA family biotin operon repressor/biotin-[acetyl-CoA-carboxylase] ligase|tara:strand:+ start:1385 stop:2143 length:759 start_codon:yes stop_codon:yes gene_type:complete
MKKIIGKKILFYDTVISTMDLAKKLIGNVNDIGTIIVAENQTHGRGSNNRKWISNGGDALFSFILKFSIKHIHLLALTTSYSIMQIIKPETKSSLQIKWPNDVLVDEKKISGVLVNNFVNNSDEIWAVVGVGINVNSNPENIADLIYPATSMKNLTNRKFNVKNLIEKFSERFSKDYLNLISNDNFYQKIESHLYSIGEERIIRNIYNRSDKKTKTTKQKILGLNSDGTLLVENINGITESISSGEIAFINN